MSNGAWTPWKLFAVGMGLVAVTAVVTAAVVADWSGKQTIPKPSTPSAVPAGPAPVPPPAARAPRVPTAAVIQACNQYAAGQVGRQDKTTEVVKDSALGAALGAAMGAATGAIADGGKGAGKGAAIGGLLGAGGGTLYGLNESKQHDRRYRDAYAACMRDRGYSG